MCHAILQNFWEGRSNYYFSSFYLICKPTASALENAVNKVTLVFLAMLAKIGYLFTREILFVLLSIGCVATTLEWCLSLCLWFSIENVKTVPYLWWKSHRSENTLKYCTVCPAVDWWGGFSSTNNDLLTPNLLPFTYLFRHIYCKWKITMRDFEKGRTRRGVLLVFLTGVLIFGGNEDWSGLCKWMLQEFIDEYLIQKPLDPNQCLIWPSPKWHHQGHLDRATHHRPYT